MDPSEAAQGLIHQGRDGEAKAMWWGGGGVGGVQALHI